MIAYVWVHVGCLPQIHKQLCQQQDRIMNTNMCNASTCKLCVFTFFFMGMRHIPVCNIIAWLYMYACMCMIVWQCAHHVMMTNTRPYTVSNSVSSNMIAYVSIHVGWDTWWSSGGFRCRYLLRFWRVPMQIPVQVPGPGSFTIVQHHCIVWLGPTSCEQKMKRSRNFQTVGDSTWVYHER